MLTFKDFFKMSEQQERQEQTTKQKAISLHNELKRHFDLKDDDYSKKANIWINLKFINTYLYKVENVGTFNIYGPYIFNNGTLMLYKQLNGSILEIWNNDIFKDGNLVGKFDRNNVFWGTDDLYQIAQKNELDKY